MKYESTQRKFLRRLSTAASLAVGLLAVALMRAQADDLVRLHTMGPGDAGSGLGSGVAGLYFPGNTNNPDDVVVAASEVGLVRLYRGTNILASVADPISKLGAAVAAIGDVNRDGFGDWAVSALGGATNYVAVYSGHVVNGTVERLRCSENPWIPNSGYGYSLAAVGDIDGDTYPDYAIGAPGLGNNPSWSGAFMIRSGSNNCVLREIIGNAVLGQANLGIYLKGIGDVNNDQYNDLAVGAIFYNGNQGFARVYSGKALIVDTNAADTIWQHFGNPGDYFGVVLGSGDFDGDHTNDVVVGGPQYGSGYGYAKVLNGRNGAVLGVLQKTIETERVENDYFGSRGAVADFDGDGKSDILISAPTYTGVGSIWGFSGASTSFNLLFHTNGSPGIRFGTSVATLGTNALGRTKFAVTAEWFGDREGIAYVYSYGPEPVAPMIQWPRPADIPYGTLLSAVQLNAQAVDSTTLVPVAGTFDYQPPAGHKLGVGIDHELVLTFTPSDSSTYLPVTFTNWITVVRATPSLTLASSANPSQLGQTIDLVATVGSSEATGTVAFFDGSLLLGTVPVSPSGTATLSISGLSLGSHSLQADYSGDGNFEAASEVLTQVVKQTVTVTVSLHDSHGAPIIGGRAQYYQGSWHDIGFTDGSGEVEVELAPGTYNFAMDHAGGRITKVQDIAANAQVDFETIEVTVELTSSTSAPLANGKVQYYGGTWRDVGYTDASGLVVFELLPGNYNFAMDYAFARVTKVQNVAVDAWVAFRTVKVTAHLADSDGLPLSGGRIQYYGGTWRDVGFTDSQGEISTELLPGTYNFAVEYAYGRLTKIQTCTADSTVEFQTIRTVVRLRSSGGAPLSGAKVQYYAGTWRDVGLTAANGEIAVQLLAGSYNFSVDYAFGRNTKVQNIGVNSAVSFETIPVTVQLADSFGNPLSGGVAQYYSGTWRSFGTTGANGNAGAELLPGSYNFSIDYGYGRTTKIQDVAVNGTVGFQTGRVHSNSGACIQFYGGGWRTFVNDTELLPGNWNFRFNDGTPNTISSVSAGVLTSIH